MIVMTDDLKKNDNCAGKMSCLGNFIKETRLIRTLIATGVLLYTLQSLVSIDMNNIALIAIFSGIAGSAATFLFSSVTGKNT